MCAAHSACRACFNLGMPPQENFEKFSLLRFIINIIIIIIQELDKALGL